MFDLFASEGGAQEAAGFASSTGDTGEEMGTYHHGLHHEVTSD
jgi:hypothetical protein